MGRGADSWAGQAGEKASPGMSEEEVQKRDGSRGSQPQKQTKGHGETGYPPVKCSLYSAYWLLKANEERQESGEREGALIRKISNRNCQWLRIHLAVQRTQV